MTTLSDHMDKVEKEGGYSSSCTLRDYFPEQRARLAYIEADAMLKAREGGS